MSNVFSIIIPDIININGSKLIMECKHLSYLDNNINSMKDKNNSWYESKRQAGSKQYTVLPHGGSGSEWLDISLYFFLWDSFTCGQHDMNARTWKIVDFFFFKRRALQSACSLPVIFIEKKQKQICIDEIRKKVKCSRTNNQNNVCLMQRNTNMLN